MKEGRVKNLELIVVMNDKAFIMPVYVGKIMRVVVFQSIIELLHAILLHIFKKTKYLTIMTALAWSGVSVNSTKQSS